MASGSWNFGTSNPYIEGRVEWWANQQGAVNNYSDVRVRVLFHRTNSGYQSWGTLNTRVRLDTANADTRAKDFSTYITLTEPGNWVTVCDNSAYRVYHNSDGKKSCYIRVYGDADFGCSFDTNRTVTFDTIPRYTSITTWSVASKTNSSITFNWGTADTISNIVCKFNGSQKYSSSVNASNGSFTISGLSEYTTYSNITITVTRKDSGLTTTSSALTATTNYTPPTSNLSLASRSINSITLNWSSNFVCDAIWIYNGGTQIYSSAVNSSSSSVTLSPSNWSALSPGTTYSLTVKVRRSASQATATSSSLSVTTLPLPYIDTSTPSSIIIGNSIPVVLSNYANNASTLYYQIYNTSNSWATISQINVAKGTSSTTITPSIITLYQNCPSSNTLATRIACSVTNNNKTYTSYYNITANVANSNPTFSDFTWETNVGTDINSVISGTQNTITRFGNLRIKFEANSATALNSSTISKLEARILFNNSVITTVNINYSSSAFTFDVSTQNIINAGTYIIQVLAIDSRGNKSNSVSHSFNVYPYLKPTLQVTMNRLNNFEQNTFIDLSGKVSKVTISSVQKNAIISLKYRYAESGASFPDTYTDIINYSTENIASTDELLVVLKKTEADNPFINLSYEKSYVFQFILTDRLYESDVCEVFVAQGKPVFAVSDDGYVGVDKIPDFSSPAKLQVNSDIIAYDEKEKRDVLLVDSINKINSDLSTRSNLVKSLYLLMHPVGDIIMTASSTNPGTIWGGTWVAWGSGRVPVGVNTSDGNFNTVEKTGGTATINLGHSHTVSSHTHGMSHSHTVNSHTHSVSSHKHVQTFGADDGQVYMNGGTGPYGSVVYNNSWVNVSRPGFIVTAARFHYTSEAGGGNTGGSAPGTNTGTRTSTDGTTPGTNSQLSTTQSVLQPYITCYMWKRTA